MAGRKTKLSPAEMKKRRRNSPGAKATKERLASRGIKHALADKPKSDAHRKAISAGLKAYWANKKKSSAQKNVAAKRAARANGTGQWTAKVDKESIALFKTLPTSQIRKRQSLAEKQMATAYKTGNTKALKDLQKMHDALTREMLNRVK